MENNTFKSRSVDTEAEVRKCPAYSATTELNAAYELMKKERL